MVARISERQERAEARRLQALELKRQGWTQVGIAQALGASKGAVSQWFRTVREQGEEGLLARPHTGRPPLLTNEQKWMIPEFLSHGAEAYGFRGDVWTCLRVGKVIDWELGVTYGKSQVACLLKELKWTPQLPIERATQRDEDAIARWRREEWLEIKKEHDLSTEPLFSWTNRDSTCCLQRSEPMRRSVAHRSCVSFKPEIICR